MKILWPKSLFFVLIGFTGLGAESSWKEATVEANIGNIWASRLKSADLNGDQLPDLFIREDGQKLSRPRVFLNATPAGSTPKFKAIPNHHLPPLAAGDVLVFTDIDNDGIKDALLARYLDFYQDDYEPPASPPYRTAWQRGNGDGTFSKEAHIIHTATMATTRAIAINDVNEDGYPDLFLGNWYERYFSGYEAFENDLLLQVPGAAETPTYVRWDLPDQTRPTDYRTDLGGRPTYGTVIGRLDSGLPYLLELNYGRRWNRLYQMSHRDPLRDIPWREDREAPPPLYPKDPAALPAHLVRMLKGHDIAPESGLDGDTIRHGRHPKWPDYLATDRPRSTRPDEPPFRANGNTFDAAIGDLDNDGDFDLLLTTIIHAWAGESSDRSRLLYNQLQETGNLGFITFSDRHIDRIPDLPPPGEPLDYVHTRYNQGDIYGEFADLNHDGLLDVILCSSDYPDPPPHDERLRIYFQQWDNRFLDVTHKLGIDHVGAGMPTVADMDGDGDLDILVGQSFNRLSREQRRAAAMTSGALDKASPEDARPEPRARLFLNQSAPPNSSIQLTLSGLNSPGVTVDAYGTVVKLTADLDGDPASPDIVQQRQVMGPGGHAGKQHPTTLHFGLGKASAASQLVIDWPGDSFPDTVIREVKPGHYRIEAHTPDLQPIRN